MTPSELTPLEKIRETIALACQRVERDPDEVQLVAVSKTFPAQRVRDLADEGQQIFGESRVQEAGEKIPLLPSKLEWHFIGRLQKNKVRKALPLFTTFHSVAELELAQRLEAVAAELGLHPRVYLQVNLVEEASKQGFSEYELDAALPELLELPHIEICGLMAIPPYQEEAEASRPHFAALRILRDRLEQEHSVPLPGLSMGMSHDFAVAIEEGATIVRVGTALFGER